MKEVQMSEARERVVVDVRRNEEDIHKLYNAAVEGCVTTLNDLLLKDQLILNEALLTSFNETPLHIASSLGHLAFARVLLVKNRQFAKELDSLARSPLHLASAMGHLDMVKLLIDANDEVCLQPDRDNQIPLHLAAIRGRVDVIQELIRASPDSAHKTLNGDNVVHLCVKYCHWEALIQLLKNDTDDHQLLHSKDSDGNTVLHLAAMLNHLKVVKCLGSLPGIQEIANELNHDGHTALDVFEKGHSKATYNFRIQQILIEIGVPRAEDLTGHISSPPPLPAAAAANVNGGDGAVATTLESAIRAKWDRVKRNIREHDWVREAHGNQMVVATVIATMCFQAMMNPPGGVWQQDTDSGSSCTPYSVCAVGTPVLSYGRPEAMFFHFVKDNTKAFLLSMGILLMHFGGFPLKTKFGAWASTIAMWYTISYLTAVYIDALYLFRIYHGSSSKTSFTVWRWMLRVVMLIHTIRTSYLLESELDFICIRRFCGGFGPSILNFLILFGLCYIYWTTLDVITETV